MLNAIASIDMTAEGEMHVRGGLSSLATALKGWEPKQGRKGSATKR